MTNFCSSGESLANLLSLFICPFLCQLSFVSCRLRRNGLRLRLCSKLFVSFEAGGTGEGWEVSRRTQRLPGHAIPRLRDSQTLANSDANYEKRSLRMNRLFHQSSGFTGVIVDELKEDVYIKKRKKLK